MAYLPVEECDFIQDELENDHKIHLSLLPKKVNYFAEVYYIMYAFGDVKEPLDSSVKLMCNILENQMALLIKSAEDVMKRRKGKKIIHKDVLFLMRKNKVLLKRLLQFLFVEDAKAGYRPNLKKWSKGFAPENGERVSKCLKYLTFIEKFTGDLSSLLKDGNIVDLVYLKRLKRRDLMAESMTREEYEFFSDTLKITFCHKYTKERFRRWLQQCSSIMTEITPLALTIIHFLARETVAGIVDKALEIKSRKYKPSDNLLENFSNPVNVFHELEDDLDVSEDNLQLSLPETSKNTSDHKNYFMKATANTSVENKIEESKNINSDTLLHIPDTSNTNKVFNFSLNFQQKTFSICCDGSKTFEVDINSAPKKKRFRKAMDIKKEDLATYCKVEFIENSDFDDLKRGNSNLRPSIDDLDKSTENFSFINPIKSKLRIHWFPEEAITPEEIEAAFIYYQHPLPISYLMKTKSLNVDPKKIRLVSLVSPEEFS